MTDVMLVQLPIPRLNYGRRTGNIPLGAACLKQAAADIDQVRVKILPESIASFLGDAALLSLISKQKPDIIGFSVFSWNIERVLFLSQRLKTLFSPKIVIGGPEVTPDNPIITSADIDFLVYGEGEAVFRKLLADESFWSRKHAAEGAADLFRNSSSPYLSCGLEPEIENIMLLETQRGCPYHCAFCYYNKSHGRLSFVSQDRVLEAVRWAVDQGLAELFLLDPSLNVRPELPDMLKQIQRINSGGRLAIFSEIRAEGIDDRLADLFAAAGFKGFEIGLQTTHPAALKAMRRSTDIHRFLNGTRLLKAHNISVALDLIMGLPADDLGSFRRSVDFVANNDLSEDVQLFPLTVLPGTEFRRRRKELGLVFGPHPPYSIEQTPTFGRDELLAAVDYAENRLNTVFFPPPNLDIAWHWHDSDGNREPEDVYVRLGSRAYLNKMIFDGERPLAQVAKLARRLTLPYQIFFGPQVDDPKFVGSVIEILTEANPFSPLEVVLFDPAPPIAGLPLLDHIRLQRPHFLDGDLRYLFPRPGNRAALFTMVSRLAELRFQNDMQRQIYWWTGSRLPERSNLEDFFELDGVLIDVQVAGDTVRKWQDCTAPLAEDMPYISFARLDLQKRWIALTAADDHANGVMDYVSS